MSIQRFLTVTGAVALAACASSQQAVDRPSPAVAQASTAVANMQWNATMMPQSGTAIGGSAAVMAGSSAEQTSATVTLTGAESGAVHPWHIHSGRCGDNGPIVGPASAYPPLTVTSDGSATAEADLPFATPTSGNFYVNVHRSQSEMGTIVSCGNLTMGAQ